MRLIQENEDGWNVWACGFCGSTFTGAIQPAICNMCGAEDGQLVLPQAPMPSKEDSLREKAKQIAAADPKRNPPVAIPRCAICGDGRPPPRYNNRHLDLLCDACIEMIQALNSAIEEMVESEHNTLVGTIMRKLRGKGDPGLVGNLLNAFKLYEKL